MKISKANKEKLMQRFKQPEEIIEEPQETFETTDEDFSFLEPVGVEPPASPEGLSEEILEALYQQGYNAYLRGKELTECPIDRFEDEDEQDQEIATAVWQEGWQTAAQQYLTAQIVLDAQTLVQLMSLEDLTEEEGETISAVLDELAESVEMLGNFIDLDEYAAYWDNMR